MDCEFLATDFSHATHASLNFLHLVQGRIQFFIDALDRAVWDNETEVIINRFPIYLELQLGVNFTERIAYTGIYNIPGLGFNMSFRVQCSENYYGPNCTTFCEPLKDVYNCSREGSIVFLQERQNPTTNFTTCLPQFTGENCKSERAPFCDHLYPHSEYFLSSCTHHNIICALYTTN